MSLRDIISPALAGERRLTPPAEPALRRVFANDLYEVFVALYPGGLLTTLVHYKREGLRIMSRLGECPSSSGDSSSDDGWVRLAIGTLQSSGKNPFHLIRDAKLECKLQLSLHDRAALRLAGVEVPRSAGRFREMFKDNY